MKVAMYLRVDNKEQLDVETDMKKKKQAQDRGIMLCRFFTGI